MYLDGVSYLLIFREFFKTGVINSFVLQGWSTKKGCPSMGCSCKNESGFRMTSVTYFEKVKIHALVYSFKIKGLFYIPGCENQPKANKKFEICLIHKKLLAQRESLQPSGLEIPPYPLPPPPTVSTVSFTRKELAIRTSGCAASRADPICNRQQTLLPSNINSKNGTK